MQRRRLRDQPSDQTENILECFLALSLTIPSRLASRIPDRAMQMAERGTP
jgi:hypothetical protein